MVDCTLPTLCRAAGAWWGGLGGGWRPSCAVSPSWGHRAGGCSPCWIGLPILPRHGRFYRCVACFHLPEGDENAVTAESLPLQQTRLLLSSPLLLLISLPSPSPQHPQEDPNAWAGPSHPFHIPTPRQPHPRSLAPGPWGQQGYSPMGVMTCGQPMPCTGQRANGSKKGTYQGQGLSGEHEP